MLGKKDEDKRKRVNPLYDNLKTDAPYRPSDPIIVSFNVATQFYRWIIMKGQFIFFLDYKLSQKLKPPNIKIHIVSKFNGLLGF
jgi:hypothetical protein